jgi:hypothetical protein
MKKIFFALLLLSSVAACKRDAEDLPEERLFTRDFYAQGVWQDTAVVNFNYTVGRQVEPPFGNVFSCESQAEIINGYKTIRCNFFGTSNNELLFIRFKAPVFVQPGETAVWTRTELESLLTPGKVFQMTGAPGQADMGMARPGGFFYRISLSSNAPSPSGQVKVISVEDYTWSQQFFDGSRIDRYAKKVLVQYEASLGVTDFTGSVVGQAEVRNGEASLYLEYQ